MRTAPIPSGYPQRQPVSALSTSTARVIDNRGFRGGNHAKDRTCGGRSAVGRAGGTPPAGAVDLTDGGAEVTLGVCAQASSQTDTYIPNCSYTYLTKKAAPSYTYLTSQGAVSWNDGSVTGTTLSFPAAGQTWPALTGLYLGASSVTTPKNITGTVDATGRVDLAMDYDKLLTAGSSQCRLTGTVQLSSQGKEKLGGASGSHYNAATGAFAVVSTTYSAPNAIDVTPAGCLAVNTAYDLSQGTGWFLTGTMELPGAPMAQTATVKLPKKIKPKGKTVLLKKPVVTNAGQKATAKLSWSTKKSAKGTKAKYANQEVSYKTSITTTGKAKRLYVKLRLKAPATEGYTAYSFTKKWTVKR